MDPSQDACAACFFFFSSLFSYTFLFLCIIACSFWLKPNIKYYFAVTLALLTGPVVIILSLLFSHSVMSESLWPHGLQHARLTCPSPSSGACSDSCPLSRWCHPTISFCHPFHLLPSVSQLQGLSNESALCIRWPKYWSFSFGISPSNEYSGLISFKIDWFDLLVVQGLSRVFSDTIIQKHQFFGAQLSV